MTISFAETLKALEEMGVWCASNYDDSVGHHTTFYLRPDNESRPGLTTDNIETAAALLRNDFAKSGRGDPGKQNLIEALEGLRAEAWARDWKPLPGREGARWCVPPLPTH